MEVASISDPNEATQALIPSGVPQLASIPDSVQFLGPSQEAVTSESRGVDLDFLCLKHSFKFSLSLRSLKRFLGLKKDLCEICRAVSNCKGKSLVDLRPDLALAWDHAKNVLPIEAVSPGSQKRFFWLCFLGHDSWTASPDEVARGWRMCPCCPGSHKLVPGCNDLATTHPEIAARWDFQRNSEDPSALKVGVNRKFFFQCPRNKDHHPQMYLPNLKKNPNACTDCWKEPIECGKNDFGCLYPKLEALLVKDPIDLDTHLLRPGDERSFRWKCTQGQEHTFVRTLATMTSARSKFSCPVCRNRQIIPTENSLAKYFPEIAEEWDHEENLKLTDLTPETIAPRAGHELFWKCRSGHPSYKSVVWNRTAGETGCPSCANYGYKAALPGLLYLVQRNDSEDHRGARKIGITNLTSRQTRLRHWSYQGFNVVFTATHPSGKLISELEAKVLGEFIRKELGLGQELSPEEILGGHTETFSLGGPSNEEIIARIERVKKDLESKEANDQ